MQLEFGFKDLLASLVASGARTTPAWKSLRTLRLTASDEDSSLTPAEGMGSLSFDGKSIQAPNLKNLRLDLRTAIKLTCSTNFSQEPFGLGSTSSLILIQLTPSSSTITNLLLHTYTTTPQLLSSALELEMCNAPLHAGVVDEEDMDTGPGAAPPPVGQVPFPTRRSFRLRNHGDARCFLG